MTSVVAILVMRISLFSGIARKPSRGSRTRPCSDILNACDHGLASFGWKRHEPGMVQASHIRQIGPPETSPAEPAEAPGPVSRTPQPHKPAYRPRGSEPIRAVLSPHRESR